MTHPKQTLINQALRAVSELGDIFSDAPECRAAAAAGKNLVALSQLLHWNFALVSPTVASGTLLADGVPVSKVAIGIDGSLTPEEPAESLSMDGPWSLKVPTGREFPVRLYAGECSDDSRWVVSDARAFYEALLQD